MAFSWRWLTKWFVRHRDLADCERFADYNHRGGYDPQTLAAVQSCMAGKGYRYKGKREPEDTYKASSYS